MKDVPHPHKTAQVVKDCKEGLPWTLLESSQGESLRFLLSLQSTVTGGLGDLAEALCQSDAILLFNQFPVFCPHLEHIELVLFSKKESINFFAYAKIWPTTHPHLKGRNVLYPPTSKLLAKIRNFQGLVPIYKELLVKARKRKCTFLP